MQSRARRPVGSGDHKTRPENRRSTKARPGQPHRPPRRGGGSGWRPRGPRPRQGLQPAEISRLRSGADLPETHPGCVSGRTRTSKRLTPGTRGRTGPTVARRMQLRGQERRIRPLLQSKWPDRTSAPAETRFVFYGARKVSHPTAPFETTLRGIDRDHFACAPRSFRSFVTMQHGARPRGLSARVSRKGSPRRASGRVARLGARRGRARRRGASTSRDVRHDVRAAQYRPAGEHARAGGGMRQHGPSGNMAPRRRASRKHSVSRKVDE